jgi:hypothetical protein
METRLRLDILPQPDAYTCGPTCLHAIYRYYGDDMSLAQVIAEAPQLPDGGTLAVLLACHALRRGYAATIYTYNLQVFDPTWFGDQASDIQQGLEAQMTHKKNAKLHIASAAYLEFLALGGSVRLQDLTPSLIRRYLQQSLPILTGLSATYLYRSAREYGPKGETDDIRGEPVGHFVILCGYDRITQQVLVADPLLPNPVSAMHLYAVQIDRVICSILLGTLTYDANLLIMQPRDEGGAGAHSHRR